ncbi:MAG: putative Oxidoreductase, FAD-binding [Moraxellaceae bacterium]|jgi:FAD/FMN-containing dehydrogenase|nr:putative Oxidoreductase, FAD-binding [Moraxellaceae bacterium]
MAKGKKWRRVLRLGLGLLVAFCLLVTWTIQRSGDPAYRLPAAERTVNDVTRLNPVQVGREIRPTRLDAITTALRDSRGPVSIGGGRFSQGGQIAYPESLHVDMRRYNRILSIDPAAREIRVQAGATWRQIEEALEPHNLAIRIMQTYSNFTVGGSLSVNVHGRYMGEGAIVRSVRSLQMVLADGRVIEASPARNADLFWGAIGGYGGLGIITEATLSVVPNEKVEQQHQFMPASDYAAFFSKHIRPDRNVVFHNADLYPPDFSAANAVSWVRTEKPLTDPQRLLPVNQAYRFQPWVIDRIAGSDTGKWLRLHALDPLYYSRDRVFWRSREASYDLAELAPARHDDVVYGLREFFVPVARFNDFVEVMRTKFSQHHVNVVNVSVRHAFPDPGTLLAWSRQEVFAFVVYYRQGTDLDSRNQVRAWTQALNQAAINLGGAYYLPYQVFETGAQFQAAYPRAPEFFALKAKVDPQNRFRNRLWAAHYPGHAPALETARQQTRQYYRGEEQTFLTIPEWYLVFNPKELADFLAAGKNPSDFPYMASLDEYWTQYDRVRTLTAGRYPANPQYLTMLRVIGISTTVEYMLKAAYESTLGRLSSWISGTATPEDQLIAQAHRAYSTLIYDKAWYEFGFLPWVKRIWTDTPFFGPHMIRKLERKLFFTVEFTLKAGYASVIGWASQTAYAPSDGFIYSTATVPATPADLPGSTKVIAQHQQKRILAIPRWGGFTRDVPALARAGVDFEDIAGNSRIALSVIGPARQPLALAAGHKLFDTRLVSRPDLQRQVWIVPVKELGATLRALDQDRTLTLEHVYDY